MEYQLVLNGEDYSNCTYSMSGVVIFDLNIPIPNELPEIFTIISKCYNGLVVIHESCNIVNINDNRVYMKSVKSTEFTLEGYREFVLDRLI